MSNWFSAALNAAAAIAQVVLSLSPAPDIYRVHRRRDIGEMAALPLVAMAVNNHLCSELKRKELVKLCSRAFAVHRALTLYFVLGVVGATGQPKADAGTWFRYVGVVVNVWMFASPLGTLKHVVKTKNSASIPINLSVIILVSTLLWLGMGMGILDSDFFIAGINAVGATLSFIQIVVYFYYRPERHEETTIDQQDPVAKDHSVAAIIIASPKGDFSSVDTLTYKRMASPVVPRA
ncbi:hypothetical protein PHYPSEUDO_003315 [Phytophthora pseudosyringae]|uniref:Sugar transporter SWEET1 n=1 Tax=Phytophthora pseudosyringae TaxID=221518 RepID=A0A8T1VUU8_9STRA|nr:hypothetical protein PHYPSEUDO_003315 [Phytophthora pseudosyringae]